MADPAINPTSVGAPTYEVTNSKGLIVDLRLDVSISSPFPTFDLIYPITGLQIKLVKGSNYLRFTGGSWQELQSLPSSVGELANVAVADSAGGIWLFSELHTSEGISRFISRRDPVSGDWSMKENLEFGINTIRQALITANDTIWIFYRVKHPETGVTKQAYRRIITAV